MVTSKALFADWNGLYPASLGLVVPNGVLNLAWEIFSDLCLEILQKKEHALVTGK